MFITNDHACCVTRVSDVDHMRHISTGEETNRWSGKAVLPAILHFQTTLPPARTRHRLRVCPQTPIPSLIDMTDNALDTAAPKTPQAARIAAEAARRRTFAVISHPDAGKSTLTEA